MKECALTDTIKYIGVNDTTIDLFESQYEVLDGISYNSYIIMDEKIAVMDSVDKSGYYVLSVFSSRFTAALYES